MKKIICLFIVFIMLLPGTLISFASEEDTIYVRTSDMEYTEFGTGWNSSGLKDDLNKATRVASSNGNSCEWRPQLKEGYYTVWVYKIFHTNSAKTFNFEVVSGDGKEVVTLNYADGESGWVKLGTYFFNDGSDGYVYGSGSGGNLRGGPMKFVKAAEPGTIVEQKMFSDIDESPYKAEIEILAKLGISDVSEGQFRPEEKITYGGFMGFVGRCMGNEFSAQSNEQSEITYNQAVKEIVYMLGYEVMAEVNGSYPGGFLTVANRLDVTDNTTQSGNEGISRETAVKLIYNSLFVDILEPVTIGKNVEYEAAEKVTVLNRYMNIHRIEGRVTGNYYTTLTGSSNLDKDEIRIEDETYFIGDTDADEFIGQSVIAYVKYNEKADTKKVILHIESDTDNGEILVIDSPDIQNDTTTKELRYYVEGKTKKAAIESSPVVIYNGKAKADYSAMDFKPAYGDVTLIDNNGNGKYDVIITNNYKTLIVDGVDTYLKKLHFKGEDSDEWKSLDFGDSSKTKWRFVNADGSDVAFEDIAEWNVISVLKSNDGEVVKAIRSDARIRGIIDSLSGDEAQIKEKTYKFLPGLITNPASVKPNVRDVASYYLDFKANIACVNYADSEYKEYGFMRLIGSDGALDREVKLRIYNQNDEWETIAVADKVIFNGNYVKSDALLNSELITNNSETIKQMISFLRDENGKIELLNCVDYTGESNPQNEKLGKITLNYENEESVKVRGGNSAKVIAAKYILDGKTKIFMLPENPDDEDAYNMITYTDVYDADTLSDVRIYDVNESLSVGAMTMAATTLKSYVSGTPVGVVSTVRYALDSEGESCLKISLLNKGVPAVVYASDDVSEAELFAYALTDPENEVTAKNGIVPDMIALNKLQPGDVVQYNADKDGYLQSIRVLYRVNSPIDCEHNGTDFSSFDETDTYDAIYYASAEVAKLTNAGLIIDVPSERGSEEIYTRTHLSATSTKVIRYLSDTKSIEIAKLGDIVKGDKVFLYKRMGALELVLIVK